MPFGLVTVTILCHSLSFFFFFESEFVFRGAYKEAQWRTRTVHSMFRHVWYRY